MMTEQKQSYRKHSCTARLLALCMVFLFLFLLSVPALASPPKRIALTFDDGPHPEFTEDILSVLSENGVKATFFVIGVNAEAHPALLKRTVAEGHEIGNHTYTHTKMREQSAESFSAELERAKNVIFGITGVSPVLFRPPGGFRDGVITTVAKEQGYQMVMWSVDTKDWTGASAEHIEKAIFDNVKDGSIILCHDYIVGEGHTAEALSRVIPRLKAEGYEFVTVSELVRKR